MALLLWAWLSFIKQCNVGCNWRSISLDTSEDSANHDSELSQTRGDGTTVLLTYSLPPRIGWELFPGFFHSWHFQFTLHVNSWSSSAQRAPSDKDSQGSHRACDGKLWANHIFPRWCNNISNSRSLLHSECRVCLQLEEGLHEFSPPCFWTAAKRIWKIIKLTLSFFDLFYPL